MRQIKKKQSFIRKNILAIVGLCLSLYFSYHLVAGHRGYYSLVNLEREITVLTAKYAALEAEREVVERKVKMMRPGSVDRDLLEERARHVLGYQRSDEVALIHSSK